MTDKHLIKLLLDEVERKLGWKDSSSWTNSSFLRLESIIFEKTATSISHQTLKRLFGKVKYKQNYSPQLATKDALSIFLGYQDWNDFVRIHDRAEKKQNNFSLLHWLAKNKKIVILCLTLLIILVGFSGIFIIKSVNKNAFVFYAENASGVIPHTVSFHYDISKIRGHDVFIDFDQKEIEDTSKFEKLNKDRNLINHCFDAPGFFNVRLIVDGDVCSSAKVHVLSENWNSYYFEDDNFSLRKFNFGLERNVDDCVKDGLLYISPEILTEKGIRRNTVYYIEHMLFKEFPVSADSCEMEVKYINTPEMGGISCYDVEFRLIGENGLVSVMLVQQGCYRWSEVTVGDMHLNGKFNDLIKLSADMSTWNVLKIEIKDYNALFMNGLDTIFSTKYNQPIGKIKGIRFVTKGSGAFDYVKLLNTQRTLKFEDHFEN